MSSSSFTTNNVLADKDINASATAQNNVQGEAKADVKSMEYHRQVLQNKLEESQYVFQPDLVLMGSIEEGNALTNTAEANKPMSRHPIPS